MKRIVVTGAAGFLGNAVLAALAARSDDIAVRAIDRTTPCVPNARFTAVTADLGDVKSIPDLVGDADLVLHLAALPGGAAEADPAASRRVNLDASLALIGHIAGRRSPARFVYASSIAVFGAPLPGLIDDATLPIPAMTYGAHKLMVETALADASRRGSLEGAALRFPGLVARPGAGTGLRSAFMTEIFHAALERRPYTVPVSRGATVWVMSIRQAARNILHAAFKPHEDGQRVALTLPALLVTMEELVDTVLARTGSKSTVRYDADVALEAQFGSLPPLNADLALAAGYRADDGVQQLVDTVLADLGMTKETFR